MDHVRLAIKDWKAAAQSKGIDSLVGRSVCIKGLGSSAQPQSSDGLISYIISDDGVDRDNDTIDPGGWDFKDYNGVWLFGHNTNSLPIGKAVRVYQKGAQVWADVDFREAAKLDEMAHKCFEYIKAGLLPGCSVGFIPDEAMEATGRKGFGLDFKRQRLLEVSSVPVASNPRAQVAAAKAAGLDTEFLIGWAERLIEEEKGPGMWLPKHVVAQVYKSARPDMIISIPAGVPSPAPAEASAPAPVDAPAPTETADKSATVADGASIAEPADGDASPPASAVSPLSPDEAFPDPEETLGKAVDEMVGIVKAGRVVSARNMERLVSAMSALRELVDEATGEPAVVEGDDSKSAPVGDDAFVVTDNDTPAEPGIDITEAKAFAEALADFVRQETQTVIRETTGFLG